MKTVFASYQNSELCFKHQYVGGCLVSLNTNEAISKLSSHCSIRYAFAVAVITLLKFLELPSTFDMSENLNPPARFI